MDGSVCRMVQVDLVRKEEHCGSPPQMPPQSPTAIQEIPQIGTPVLERPQIPLNSNGSVIYQPPRDPLPAPQPVYPAQPISNDPPKFPIVPPGQVPLQAQTPPQTQPPQPIQLQPSQPPQSRPYNDNIDEETRARLEQLKQRYGNYQPSSPQRPIQEEQQPQPQLLPEQVEPIRKPRAPVRPPKIENTPVAVPAPEPKLPSESPQPQPQPQPPQIKVTPVPVPNNPAQPPQIKVTPVPVPNNPAQPPSPPASDKLRPNTNSGPVY